MTVVSDAGANLIRDLLEISGRQKLSPEFHCHLAHYFADVDSDGLGETNPEALFGAAIQHHHLGRSRGVGQAALSFYTPDFDRHGWHSPHTVIDVVTDDMAFLVDSLTMAIDRHGLNIHCLLHPVLGVERDANGSLLRTEARGSTGTRNESWIHLEIDRIGDASLIEALHAELLDVLDDVRAANEDAEVMKRRIAEIVADPCLNADVSSSEIAEFLRWLTQGNFVFLGYTAYVAPLGGDRPAGELKRSVDGGLGLLRRVDHPRFGRCLANIPGGLAELGRLPSALTLVKADGRSTVHRPAYLDFIGVCHHDAAGNIVGEHVFVGLYAAHVYHVSVNEIPVVCQKVAAIRAACGFAPGGHKDKTLINVLETYPRDELIESAESDLLRIANGMVTLHEHPQVRVFLRNDRWGRYVSALVYMPRDRYDTNVRRRITQVLSEMLQADSVEFFHMVGESRLARLQLIARVPAGKRIEYDAAVFEREVARIVRGWYDELQQHLIEHCGEAQGNALLRRYARALPLAYQEQVLPTSAVADLEYLALAEKTGRIEVKLNAPYGDEGAHQHIKLFLDSMPRPLSSVLPVFDNMGVTVLTEQPFKLTGSHLHIADFAVRLPRAEALEDEATRAAFIELLEKVLRDEAENDGFNRLTLLAGLDAPRIVVLRAYARYLRQAGLSFSQAYIERCLATYPAIARLLSALFESRLAPPRDEDEAASVADELTAALESVGNVDDDRILAAYRMAIEATLRTNAWQTDADGRPKDYLSFKIASKDIPFLPKPVPLYEIFVYSPRMEGIHLRGSRVLRGGLRWSDRMEDFRTEGLGLVKAQMVKNVVSVPLGAKGCFVGKRLPPASEREAYQEEGIACYKTYIRGLLDITDNLVDGQIVPPRHVRRRDGDDPYLVVAADKGTATFSDIANGIALEYGFWLGDAFASGGSRGYDHKKMAITARGAWEAVKRHFREMGDAGDGKGRDTQNETFTAVGIGDMSGDVFGNGALRSNMMRLVAAFDHRHIFLDPNPDAAASFAERQRLFDLPRSSWDDYDKTLISAGGGVWSRSVRSISLSAPVRERLAISAEQMTPNELINAILKAPVDLLYNGGIGTYVKASSESHLDANDRANDAVRVDATELRAKVVGEGGNLGLTQKARIEYALAGGRINTDAIDNSGGVGCSDHEVNIKILVSGLVASGDMTGKQRDELLASMTDDIARLVLIDNYQQTQAISLEATAAQPLLSAHTQLIRYLEGKGAINRLLEVLPSDKGLVERGQAGRGLTRPEIAVLLAHAKIHLKEAILASALPDAEELQALFAHYFPEKLVAYCPERLAAHPLKREIVTTQLVNRMVNRMGTTFALQLGDETGASPAQVMSAWFAASELLGAEALWQELEALDLQLPVVRQLVLMSELRALILAATRQLLVVGYGGGLRTPAMLVAPYREALSQAMVAIRQGADASSGLEALLAARHRLVAIFEQVDLSQAVGVPLDTVEAICQRFGERLDLVWLGEAISRLPADNRWQARARSQLAGELRKLRQALILPCCEALPATLPDANRVVDDLKRNAPQDLAMLSAGLAEIRRVLAV